MPLLKWLLHIIIVIIIKIYLLVISIVDSKVQTRSQLAVPWFCWVGMNATNRAY